MGTIDKSLMGWEDELTSRPFIVKPTTVLVPPRGFEVVERKGQPYLAWDHEHDYGEDAEGRRVPLPEGEVFARALAELDPGSSGDGFAGLVMLANRVGWLRTRHEGAYVFSEDGNAGFQTYGWGSLVELEPIWEWCEEIGQLRCALHLWDALNSPDPESALQLQFEPDEDGSCDWDYTWQVGPCRGNFPTSGWRPDKPGAKVRAAWRMLDTLLTIKLSQVLGVGLVSNDAGNRLEPGGHPRLVIRPGGMLGVAWLEVVGLVEGSKKADRCQQCEKWFWGHDYGALNRSGSRRKRFCSDECRNRFNYRQRKAAKEAHGQEEAHGEG